MSFLVSGFDHEKGYTPNVRPSCHEDSSVLLFTVLCSTWVVLFFIRLSSATSLPSSLSSSLSEKNNARRTMNFTNDLRSRGGGALKKQVAEN